MSMRILAILGLLTLSGALASPQDKTKSEREYVHRCAPKLLSHAGRGKLPEFQFRKGAKFRHSPLLTYEVLDSGKVSHTLVKRGSGVVDIDAYALRSVQALRYTDRPGCGSVGYQIVVTIDFTGGE
jgi:hypothetical protein